MKRFAFAPASILLGSLFVVAACGGKVVFDGAPGSGGHGGATSSSTHTTSTLNTTSTSSLMETSTGDVSPETDTSTSTDFAVTSTSTTMQATSVDVSSSFASSADALPCDCNTVCNVFASCGLQMSTCQQLCQQASGSQLMCLCQAGNCNGALGCLQGSTGFASAVSGGTGSGAGGASPGGEHPPKACRDCINNEAQSDCQMQAVTCESDPACDQVRQCHHDCGYGGSCTQQCEGGVAQSALDEYTALIQCADCQFCPMQCANTAISSEYCIFNGSSATAP